MSQGIACKCAEKKKPLLTRNWVVIQYKCNHSAFNGWHYARSDYSQINCKECLTHWRTKAPYVTDLYLNGLNAVNQNNL